MLSDCVYYCNGKCYYPDTYDDGIIDDCIGFKNCTCYKTEEEFDDDDDE